MCANHILRVKSPSGSYVGFADCAGTFIRILLKFQIDHKKIDHEDEI